MWNNITIVGRILIVALAIYGAYSGYLKYREHKDKKKNK